MADQLRAFPGLHYFEDNALDRALFFGRETEIKQLTERIIAEDLTVLFGKSGDGKTSLINAGLKPALRDAGYWPVRARVFNVVLPKTPLEALYEVMAAEAAANNMTLPPDWPHETLWESFLALRPTPENGLKPIVLILDQFEELFTLMAVYPDEQEEFIAQLADLARGRLPESVREKYRDQLTKLAPESETARQLEQLLYGSFVPSLRLVLSLREDYLAFLNNLGQRIPKVFASRYRLSSLTIEQARAAIANPPQQEVLLEQKFYIEDEAIEALLKFLTVQSSRSGVNEETVGPPQLQVLCQQLEAQMRQAGKNRISLADLGGETGMRKLLSRYYRGILEKFPRVRFGSGPRRLPGLFGLVRQLQPLHSPRLAVRQLCEERLITAGGNRNSRHEDEIIREIGVAPADLQQLVESRLLRREPRLQEAFYELSHDSLVPSLQVAGGMRQSWAMGLKVAALVALIFIVMKWGLPYVRSVYEMKSLTAEFDNVKKDTATVEFFRARLASAGNIVAPEKLAALQKEFDDWRKLKLQSEILQANNLLQADTLLQILSDEYPREKDLLAALADTLLKRHIRQIAQRYNRLVDAAITPVPDYAKAGALLDSAYAVFQGDIRVVELQKDLEKRRGNRSKVQELTNEINLKFIKDERVSRTLVELAAETAVFRRREPDENLTEEEVDSLIKKYDFYCAEGWPWSNPTGKGLANDFVPLHSGQVILDRATGLLWQQLASSLYMTFADAQKYIEDLNRRKFAGYSDWRLPTLEEAMSLMEPVENLGLYIDAKFDVKQRWIWTSDFYSAGSAWVVDFSGGVCSRIRVTYGLGYGCVRAVR